MNRDTWNLIKKNKNFNVHIFRRGITVLIAFLILICFLQSLIFYFYLRQPEPDYYETNGITDPMKLTPLLTPNFSSVPLLEADPPIGNLERELPP